MNWNADVSGLKVKTFAQLSIGEPCQRVDDWDFLIAVGASMLQDKLKRVFACIRTVQLLTLMGYLMQSKGEDLVQPVGFSAVKIAFIALGRHTVLGTHQSLHFAALCPLKGRNIGCSKSFTLKVENQQLAFEPLGLVVNGSQNGSLNGS